VSDAELPEAVHMTDPLPEAAQTASDLLTASVRALVARGRSVEVDWELETFVVGDVVMGVVMSSSRSVVLHAVRPQLVSAAALVNLVEAVPRINTRLSTSAVEVDLGTGALSVRAGLEVGDVAVPEEVFAGLLGNLLDEVERAWGVYGPVLEAVIDGRLDPAEVTAHAD